jgi:hypothetical protein
MTTGRINQVATLSGRHCTSASRRNDQPNVRKRTGVFRVCVCLAAKHIREDGCKAN